MAPNKIIETLHTQNNGLAIGLLKHKEAVYRNNIKHFLKPWYSFRLYIVFKKTKKPDGQNRMHFFGNEHNCTLNQLISGFKTKVTMDRYKGLTDLIKLVEKDWKGTWTAATIYMRNEHGGEFETEVRKYYLGKLQDEQTPVLDPPYLDIYYHGKDENGLPVFSLDQIKESQLPDFSQELSKI